MPRPTPPVRPAVTLCAWAVAALAVLPGPDGVALAQETGGDTAEPGGITAADPMAGAQAVVDAWCNAVMALDERAATALMSPDLRADVDFARSASDAFAASHPGEKPPMGDGLPLTAFADKVSACSASNVSPAGALLTFTATGGGAATWTDALEFVPGPDGKLMIGDVLYAPERLARMTEALAAMAETGE